MTKKTEQHEKIIEDLEKAKKLATEILTLCEGELKTKVQMALAVTIGWLLYKESIHIDDLVEGSEAYAKFLKDFEEVEKGKLSQEEADPSKGIKQVFSYSPDGLKN